MTVYNGTCATDPPLRSGGGYRKVLECSDDEPARSVLADGLGATGTRSEAYAGSSSTLRDQRRPIRIPAHDQWSSCAGVGGVVLASRARSVADECRRRQSPAMRLPPPSSAVRAVRRRAAAWCRRCSCALVIASIENGMGLLGLPQGTKFIITGLVLLGAVLIDALSKRTRAAWDPIDRRHAEFCRARFRSRGGSSVTPLRCRKNSTMSGAIIRTHFRLTGAQSCV